MTARAESMKSADTADAPRFAESEESALLAAILADPADDAPRLILADWLQDNAGQVECDRCDRGDTHGSPKLWASACSACQGRLFVSDGRAELAEFIRVQIARVRNDTDGLDRREATFADEAERWLRLPAPFETGMWSGLGGEIRFGAEGGTACTFRRGFIEKVEMWTADFLAHAPALFAAHPVERVVLTDKHPHAWFADPSREHGWFRNAEYDPRQPNLLPPELFVGLSGGEPLGGSIPGVNPDEMQYPNRNAALSAASAACVSFGREKAGLPPRPAPVGSAT
jgi:uncharacterized protein (TIGR02996 family)